MLLGNFALHATVTAPALKAPARGDLRCAGRWEPNVARSAPRGPGARRVTRDGKTVRYRVDPARIGTELDQLKAYLTVCCPPSC